MSKQTSDEVGKLVRWASELGKKYDENTTTILVQFRRLKNAGADNEQAKRDVEDVYAS